MGESSAILNHASTPPPLREIGNRRHPGNLQSEFSQCFPSVLMCSETTVFLRLPKTGPEGNVPAQANGFRNAHGDDIRQFGIVRTRMWTLVGARMRAFGSCGSGVSTFSWARVTDTRERRSRHLSFYDP
ncbi:hypothetical protein CRG98_014587 [Punica granatum]|uniref:Uncharacterized protein n=1 Tax=Punica granatum TaxID=22663 RepID=A0A2I0K8X5_PUNGR|nr:hypothetical protein CRG98_014587 [Punica granatum]